VTCLNVETGHGEDIRVTSSGPLVSIVIPCYNQGNSLRQAIESVLPQDYPRIELIVLQDGSTDDTKTVFAAYAGGSTASPTQTLSRRERIRARGPLEGDSEAKSGLRVWLRLGLEGDSRGSRKC